jgi:hypothetical protein
MCVCVQLDAAVSTSANIYLLRDQQNACGSECEDVMSVHIQLCPSPGSFVVVPDVCTKSTCMRVINSTRRFVNIYVV